VWLGLLQDSFAIKWLDTIQANKNQQTVNNKIQSPKLNYNYKIVNKLEFVLISKIWVQSLINIVTGRQIQSSLIQSSSSWVNL